MHGGRRLARPGAAQQAAGAGFDDRDLTTGRPADVDCGMGIHAGGGVVVARASAQQPVVDQGRHHLVGAPRPHLRLADR